MYYTLHPPALNQPRAVLLPMLVSFRNINPLASIPRESLIQFVKTVVPYCWPVYNHYLKFGHTSTVKVNFSIRNLLKILLYLSLKDIPTILHCIHGWIGGNSCLWYCLFDRTVKFISRFRGLIKSHHNPGSIILIVHQSESLWYRVVIPWSFAYCPIFFIRMLVDITQLLILHKDFLIVFLLFDWNTAQSSQW